MKTPTSRFWAKVEKTDACWNWTGATDPAGYGVVRYHGNLKKAHRVSYEMTGEIIPDGMVLNHACRILSCVNPNHLRLVAIGESLDGPHGHNVNSGVRGVYKAGNGKWQARVTHKGKIYTAGTHHTIQSAEDAVNLLRDSLFGHNGTARRDS